MDVAAFSTGISIRWPRSDRARSVATASPFADDLPSPEAAATAAAAAGPVAHFDDKAGKASVKRENATEEPRERPRAASKADGGAGSISKSDEEMYSALQELAYQYAVEQAKSAVRTVLLKANTNCYHQVLRYFEKYMSLLHTPAAVPPAQKSLLDALVAFPEFHGFPTAAIVAGTDATFSEVWVNPLCQVLQRSFPLIFVVREDFQNARRVVEWMVEQLDAVKRVRGSEENWLLQQINSFDMLDSAAEVAGKADVSATGRRTTLRDRSALSASQRGGYGSPTNRRNATNDDESWSKQKRGEADNDDDDEFVALEDDDESDNDDDDSDSDNGWKRTSRKKRKRNTGSKAASASAAAAAGNNSAYSKWTMEQLLARIRVDLALLMGPDDPFKMWIAVLRDLVDDKLESELQSCAGNLEQALQRYHEAIEWLKKCIFACRSLPGSRGGRSSSGASANVVASVNVCSTEFSLAQMLHEVMEKFVAFLDQAAASAAGSQEPVSATSAAETATSDATDLHAIRKKKERELISLWRRRMSGFLKRHEDYYQLHHLNAKQYEDDPRRPFFLICIEQLEAFNQQVLDDFLVLWTNHSRQSALESQVAGANNASDIGSRMGFIVGVASTASPALRHLNLSIVSQIDMQFFSLEDSRKCFDDILEALIVDANLPLCLSGDVMRWVAGRHRTTQSITMFLHALEFLFFNHFKRVPWSFLSHFCLEAHHSKPLQSVLAPTKRLAQWMRRASLQATSMHDYLLLFSDAKLEQLRALVFPVVKPERDWLEVLLDEVVWLRHQRANWAVGWKCFRAACSWLDIELQGDEFTEYLAAALDGKLANTSKTRLIVQKLGTCSLRIASCLIEDWKATCLASAGGRSSNAEDKERGDPVVLLVMHLSELVLLCKYVMETFKLVTTQRMLPCFRQELQNAFSDALVVALVQPPRTRSLSNQSPQRVLQWVMVSDVQSLEDRLHFNYYDRLKDLLLEIEEGEDGGGHAGGTSWVNDVSLAFLYYQESAGIYLSLSDWYETFADALEDEFAAVGSSSASGKAKATAKKPELAGKEQEAAEVETKARFLRAFCTLRHWGFVKSIGSSESDTIEKVVFI